ncbi:MAG: membrane dipeptidase [Gammaproteobacteria bacterium]|nr:membrane dipeptidase [Gammaproteobacteria bacterium]
MSTAPAREDEVPGRAETLIESSFVFDAAHVFRVGGPDKPRLPLGNEPIDAGMIGEWRSAGLNGFLHPFGILHPDMYVGQLRLLAMWNGFIADHAEALMRIDEPADFDRARDSGRIAIMLGTHHAEPFRTVDDVDYFAGLGLRSCILVTFGQNRLGAAVDEPAGGGLTGFGRAIVARMNAVGMAVDVSHCSDRTRRDAIEASSRPVLMSHANPAGMCANPRNVGDNAVKALAARGGVMGVMPLRMLLTAQEPTTVEDYLDHMVYLCDLVGPAHVGLGLETPPEGFDSLPPQSQIPLPSYLRNAGEQRKLDLPELCHVRRLYTVVEAMLRRGFADDDIRGFIGGNFERVVREILTI